MEARNMTATQEPWHLESSGPKSHPCRHGFYGWGTVGFARNFVARNRARQRPIWAVDVQWGSCRLVDGETPCRAIPCPLGANVSDIMEVRHVDIPQKVGNLEILGPKSRPSWHGF